MPIYAYKCEACGFAQDVLRKMSDPPLTECPQCKQATFVKQVTAAGFQLKGSGWYVTDFRGGANNAATGAAAPKAESGSSGEGDSSSTKSTDTTDTPSAAPAAPATPPATGS